MTGGGVLWLSLDDRLPYKSCHVTNLLDGSKGDFCRYEILIPRCFSPHWWQAPGSISQRLDGNVTYVWLVIWRWDFSTSIDRGFHNAANMPVKWPHFPSSFPWGKIFSYCFPCFFLLFLPECVTRCFQNTDLKPARRRLRVNGDSPLGHLIIT